MVTPLLVAATTAAPWTRPRIPDSPIEGTHRRHFIDAVRRPRPRCPDQTEARPILAPNRVRRDHSRGAPRRGCPPTGAHRARTRARRHLLQGGVAAALLDQLGDLLVAEAGDAER